VIIVASVSLLLCQGISETAERLLEYGPSIVARRVVSGHWIPVPVEEAVMTATTIPGVISATPRIWGVVNCPEGPVTVMGILLSNAKMIEIYPELVKSPGRGEALIGPGILSENLNRDIDTELVLLNGRRELKVKVTGVFTC
jgi:hypothetical protein